MTKDKKFFHGHARLAEEREKLWTTQQLAADFFGVSRVTWCQCERGNATPSGEVLAGLAQQGADVLYILTGKHSGPALALTAEEQTMLGYFREASKEVRRAALGALLGAASPSTPQQNVGAGAGMVNHGHGAVQVGHAAGKVTVKRGNRN